MLEILLLYFLSARLGRVLRDKGRKTWPLQLLLFVGWFGSEILGGAVAGFLLGFALGVQHPGQPLQMGPASYVVIYLGSLTAAGLSAVGCFLIAHALPSLQARPAPDAAALDGDVYPAELVAPAAAAAGGGRGARTVRLAVIGSGALVLALLAGAAWWAAERNGVDAAWRHLTDNPAQVAAAKQLAAVQAEVDALLRQQQDLERWRAAAPKVPPPARWTRPASVRCVLEFLERGDAIATLSHLRRDELPDAERTEIDALLRAAMRRGTLPVGTLNQLLSVLGSASQQQAFRQSLTSSEDIRLRYPRRPDQGGAGLLPLLDQTPPEAAPRLLAMIADLSPDAAQRYIAANPSRGDWTRVVSDCPRLAMYGGLVPPVQPDERWRAVIRALDQDYATAVAAAEWMTRQPVQPALREEVIAAVRNRTWLRVRDGVPAALVLCMWAEDQHAPLIAALGKTPGTGSVATHVCRILARASPTQLEEVLRLHAANPNWNGSVARDVLGIPAARAAMVAVLSAAEPQEAHAPYFQALILRGTADDLPWLTVYAERLGQTPLPADSRLPAAVQAAIGSVSRKQSRRP